MIFKEIIKGAFAGVCVGLCINFLSCAVSIVSCGIIGDAGMEGSGAVCSACAVIGAIIGIFSGIIKVNEEKESQRLAEIERKEYERQEATERKQKWVDNLLERFDKIEKRVTRTEEYEKLDKNIYCFLNVKEQEATRYGYTQEYLRYLEIHKAHLNTIVYSSIRSGLYLINLTIAVEALECLYFLDETNVQIKNALDCLGEFCSEAYTEPLTYLKFEEYGICHFDLENEDKMEYLNSNADNIYEKVTGQINGIMKKCELNDIIETFNTSLLYQIGELMWYFAKKIPFDVAKFQKCQEYFTMLKVLFIKLEEEKLVNAPVEAVLAQVYAKNQMGGETTANQDDEYIQMWLLSQIKLEEPEKCYLLVSGLAWMGLYNMEKKYLIKMVELSVQLPLELQERLNLLESGNMSKVTIYENKELDKFMYDDAALEWGTSEFDIFFHMLEKKKIKMKYSLVIKKWTNNTPLKPGQKFNYDELLSEFSEMINDFDGEVKMEVGSVKAINTNNIEYNNVPIFKFDSARNRCLTIVFSCEKYGRNLATTIFVMFTPDDAYAYSDQKNYALAIKNNIYVESFKEAIYQSIDAVLKDDIEIYSEM